MRRRGRAPTALRALLSASLLATVAVRVEAQWASYAPVPRWGQASTVIGSTLLVHGGKTAQGATNSADLLALDLGGLSDLANPAWQLSAATAPAVSFHSLSTLGSGAIVFGGESTTVALPSANDSSVLLSVPSSITAGSTASWTTQANGWASQPIRRERHAAAWHAGTLWVFGGVKADGSDVAFDELWTFDGTAWSLVTASGTAPPATYDATLSVLLVDGQPNLFLIGGATTASPATLSDPATVYRFNVATTTWSTITATGTTPTGRRGHIAIAVDNSRIFVHGGSNGANTAVYGDLNQLTVSADGASAAWSTVAASGAPAGRSDHFGALVSGHILIAFGYGTTAPADTTLHAFDVASLAWVTSIATAAPTSSTAPATSTTAATQAPSSIAPTSVKNRGSSSTPSASASASPAAAEASSGPPKTVIIAASAAGAAVLLAALIGVAVVRKRRRRASAPFASDRFGDEDGDAAPMLERRSAPSAIDLAKRVLGQSAGVGGTPRRFDMLEDEESSVWSGSRAGSRASSRRVPSGASGGPTHNLLSGSDSFVGAMFGGGKRRRLSERDEDAEATPRMYTDADLGVDEFEADELDDVVAPPSRVFSPTSLYGSSFSPLPTATPTVPAAITRSGTWWSRFSAGTASLLGPTAAVAIRDPSPAPNPYADPQWSLSSQQTLYGGTVETHTTDPTTAADASPAPTARSKRASRMLDAVSEHGYASEGDRVFGSMDSAMEERMRDMQVMQRGGLSGDSGATAEDPFADSPTAAVETPGSIVWDGGRVGGVADSVETTPLVSSPPMTPRHQRTDTAGSTGVRAMIEQYERQRTIGSPAFSLPSSPARTRRASVTVEHGLVRKPQLFVTNL